jgi:hypothetical protein
MTRLPLTLTLCTLPLVTACRDDPSDPAGGASDASSSGDAADESTSAPASDTGAMATVTYYETIKPLLDARCVSCHREGGIAPMSLETYADAASWSGASLAAIQAGTMPPWPPADGCNEYTATREVSDEELALVETWVAEQVPMGDPAKEGAPLADGDPGLTRVDVALEMSEAYAPLQAPDDYRCFLMDWPAEFTTTKYVTGYRAVPGNDAIVHHVIAYLVTPDKVDEYVALDDAEAGAGYTCFGGSGGSSRTWLGGWAPGSAGIELPSGLGLAVPPGSKVVMQVHYNTMSSDPAPDSTGFDFKVEDEVEKVAAVVPFANPAWVVSDAMLIPAGDADVMHEFQYDISALLEGPQNVWAGALHMHTRGASATLSVERADGGSGCVLDIDAWDFHWQGMYNLAAPLRLEEGDELRLECHFDNSAANQPVVDGVKMEPQDITWGEGTNDEMCLGVMLVAPA